MDRPERPEQPEPPSIFSKPDPFDEPTAPPADPGSAGTSALGSAGRLDVGAACPVLMGSRRLATAATGGTGARRQPMASVLARMLVGLGSAGRASPSSSSASSSSRSSGAATSGAVAGAGSPTASASRSVAPTIAATPEPSPTPSPTPEATPAGPPQEFDAGDWATVAVDELNVRVAAGTDAASDSILVRGAIVHVIEGPQVGRRSTGTGSSRSVAPPAGGQRLEAEPYLEAILNDTVRICGEVAARCSTWSTESRRHAKPLRIGEFALPTGASK